jgi:hypothetical protein
MPDGLPSSPPRLSVARAISPGGILADHFRGPTWDRWRAVLKAAGGEALTKAELKLFQGVAQRNPPRKPVSELWLICGRSAGKDSVASAVATVAATCDYSARLRPGEMATILRLAVDRTQASIVLNYIRGNFASSPLLKQLIVRETAEGLELANNVEIVVATNSFRSIRGRTVVCAVLDELAFWRDESSSNPDEEIYTALLPALARVPGSVLIGISSPFKKAGLLYRKWRESYGKDDPECLVVRGGSRLFNETLPQSVIDRALARDPVSAAAEWLAEWRSDVSDFISRDVLAAVVMDGVHELPYASGVNYGAFIDPAGGSGADSMALAIGHRDQDGLAVVDCIRVWDPPFSPEQVADEVAGVLRSYHVHRLVGDRFAGEWGREPFARRGFGYEIAKRSKSDYYLAALPILNSHKCRLLEHQRGIVQLAGLERRSIRGGADKVDHVQNAHDDIANVIAGVLVEVGGGGPSDGWVQWCREQVAGAKVRLGAAFKVSDFERLGPPAASPGSVGTDAGAPAPEASDAYLAALAARNSQLTKVDAVHPTGSRLPERPAAAPVPVVQGTLPTERGATAMVQQLPGEHVPLAAGEVRLQAQPWQAFYVPAPNGGGRKFTGDAHGVIVAPSEFLPALVASGCRPVG